MTTIINGSSPSVTFSDGTTQTTAGLPLTGGTVSGNVTVNGNIIQGANTAPTFSVYLTSSQSIASGGTAKIQFNIEEFDTNSNYDNTTNYRFTPTVAGYYQINAFIAWGANVSSGCATVLYKNGTAYKIGNYITNANIGPRTGINSLVSMNGSTDYLEIYGINNTAATLSLSNTSTDTFFQGFLARSA